MLSTVPVVRMGSVGKFPPLLPLSPPLPLHHSILAGYAATKWTLSINWPFTDYSGSEPSGAAATCRPAAGAVRCVALRWRGRWVAGIVRRLTTATLQRSVQWMNDDDNDDDEAVWRYNSEACSPATISCVLFGTRCCDCSRRRSTQNMLSSCVDRRTDCLAVVLAAETPACLSGRWCQLVLWTTTTTTAAVAGCVVDAASSLTLDHWRSSWLWRCSRSRRAELEASWRPPLIVSRARDSRLWCVSCPQLRMIRMKATYRHTATSRQTVAPLQLRDITSSSSIRSQVNLGLLWLLCARSVSTPASGALHLDVGVDDDDICRRLDEYHQSCALHSTL